MNKVIFICILLLATVLRVVQLNRYPVAMYWEEVALGYDAYSILKTGKDHHGNTMPIVAFESFGDYKPSLFFYYLVPFIKLLGLNIWSVRLPSALAGILTTVGIYQLSQIIFKNKSEKGLIKPKYIAFFVAAISPWAIIFSRAGWEANLATTLITWGVFFGLKFQQAIQDQSRHQFREQSIYLLSCMLCLVLSMYAYHSARIIAPLLGIAIVIPTVLNKNKPKILPLAIALLMSVFLVSPLLLAFKDPVMTHRFQETSIFTDLELIKYSNQKKDQLNNNLYSRFFYHRYLLFGKAILSNLLVHFDVNFLFISGDGNARHSIQNLGQLYHIEFIFLIAGLIFYLKNWNSKYAFLFIWLLIGLIPASLTKATPHALRILPVMPVFIILIAAGIHYLLNLAKKKQLLILGVFSFFYLLELSFFIFNYQTVYAQTYANEWQYGYQQLIEKVSELEKKYPNYPVYITRDQGRPAMFYWFFTQTDPTLVQQQHATAKKDQGEYLEFENKHFINQLSEVTNSPAIIAASETRIIPSGFDINDSESIQINNLLGENIWTIVVNQ